MYGGEERCIQGFGGETLEKENSEAQVVILRWILSKWDVGAWAGTIWIRIGIGGGHL